MGIVGSTSAFAEALRQGDSAAVVEAINKNSALVKAHIVDDGGTAWHVLAHEGKVETMEAMANAIVSHKSTKPKYQTDQALLLKTMVHLVNKRNTLDQTPLMAACIRSHDECVKWLLAKGADPWCKADEIAGELSALHYAVRAGSKECTTTLLTFVKSHPHLRQPRQGCRYPDIKSLSAFTALHYAAWYNRKDLVSILSSFGASLTSRNFYCQYEEVNMRAGSTPLHVAARLGRGGFTKELLTAYVVRNPNRSRADDPRLIRDSHHELPFNLAMRYHHYHVVTWLHPMTPLQSIAARSDPADRVLGPPKLLEIVAPIAQKVLLDEIDALEREVEAQHDHDDEEPAGSKAQQQLDSHAITVVASTSTNLPSPTTIATTTSDSTLPPSVPHATVRLGTGAVPPTAMSASPPPPAPAPTTSAAQVATSPSSAAAGSSPVKQSGSKRFAKLSAGIAAIGAVASAGLSAATGVRSHPTNNLGGTGSIRGMQRLASRRGSGTPLASQRAASVRNTLENTGNTAILTNALDMARVERLTSGLIRQSAIPRGSLASMASSGVTSPRSPPLPPAAEASGGDSSGGGSGSLGSPSGAAVSLMPRRPPPPIPTAAASATVTPGVSPEQQSADQPSTTGAGMFRMRGILARHPLPAFPSKPDHACGTGAQQAGQQASAQITSSSPTWPTDHNQQQQQQAADDGHQRSGNGTSNGDNNSPLLVSLSLSGALLPAHELLRLSVDPMPRNANRHNVSSPQVSSSLFPTASASGGGGSAGHSFSPGMSRALSGRTNLLANVPDMLGDEVPWQPPSTLDYQASMRAMCETLQEVSAHMTAAPSMALEAVNESEDGGSNRELASGPSEGNSSANNDLPQQSTEDMAVVEALAELTASVAEILDDPTDNELERMCGVCMDDEPSFLMLQPCQHNMCISCCRELVKIHKFKPSLCPFCRRVILGFDLPPAVAKCGGPGACDQHSHMHA